MGGVPSKPTDATVTPKVIAAGFSETGTGSMARALEILYDGPVLHAGNALYGREDDYAKQWYRVLKYRKDKPQLLKLLREATTGYVAITDTPPALFIPELLELYPDAKVVLVDRNTEKWWSNHRSVLNSAQRYPAWALRILLWPCFTWRWIPYWTQEMAKFMQETHGEDAGKQLKDKHNALVRAAVPKKNLLEMQITDGWGPLCNFLKKPIPTQPFPRENDDEEAVDAAIQNIFAMATTTWLMYIFGYGIGIVGILWWVWTKGRIF